MSRMIRFLLFILPAFSLLPSYSLGSDIAKNLSSYAEIQVLDGLGQPLEGAYVTLYSDHGRTIESTRITGENGRVNFGQLNRDSMSLSVVGLDDEYKRFDGYAIYDAPVRPLLVSLELNDTDRGLACDKSVEMTLIVDEVESLDWQHEIYVNGIKQKKASVKSGEIISVCQANFSNEDAQIVVISTNKNEPALIRYGYANNVEIIEGGSITLNDISLRQWGSGSQDTYEHFISSYVDNRRKQGSFDSELNVNPEMKLNGDNELMWKVSGTQPVFTTAYFQDQNAEEYIINWEIKSPSSMSTIVMPQLPKPLVQFAHTADTQYIDIELKMTYSPDYKSITQMSDIYMGWLVDGGKKPLLTEEIRSVSLFSSL